MEKNPLEVGSKNLQDKDISQVILMDLRNL